MAERNFIMKKRIASSIIAMAISMTVSTMTVSAEDIHYYEFATTSWAVANSETVNSSENPINFYGDNSELNERLDAGETVPVLYFEDGSCLKVTVTDNNASLNQRATTYTASKTYNYTYEDWLGRTKDAFSLTYNVDYQLDIFTGYIYEGDSKLINMYGSITIHDSDFSVSWSDKFTSFAPGRATLGVTGYSSITGAFEFAHSATLDLVNGGVIIGQYIPPTGN